ncbi:hypothetical protein TNCV_4074501 [Trichonephila clavipes]|uniref:Uncharacterized protein n=1 Tax=Trichonephila clavipes TaxID=2585209 RepID=A0A8X7BH38_TRICX|nr:hypothetical protein TNCV_4074501 [Trichonephila clavipes]
MVANDAKLAANLVSKMMPTWLHRQDFAKFSLNRHYNAVLFRKGDWKMSRQQTGIQTNTKNIVDAVGVARSVVSGSFVCEMQIPKEKKRDVAPATPKRHETW